MPLHGACLCGAVRYEVRGEPLGADWCHCSRCRRFSGAAADPSLKVRAADLAIVGGRDRVRVYVEAGHADRAFCATCGSSLFGGRGLFGAAETVGVCMGTLDDDPRVRFTCHKAIAWKAPWADLPDDGLPRYEAWPPTPETNDLGPASRVDRELP